MSRARVALALAGLTLALGVEGARAAFPGENGRIAIAVERWRLPEPCLPVPHGCEPGFVSRIEKVLPSGRGRRVLHEPRGGGVLATSSGAASSPSGRLLSFQEDSHLAIIRHDGRGLRRLPQLTETDEEPAWSPDGRRLAFTGNRRCFGCIWPYTVRSDGTGLRRVLRQEARWPAWSPTGTIAFVNDDDRMGRRVGLRDGLYTVRPARSRLRQLFARRWGPLQQPDWSPDGRRIAFHARNHIFTLRADGRALRRLTDGRDPRGQGSTDTAWSPDGKYIAFIRDNDLYVMRADGRGVRRVVDAPDPDPAHPDRPWVELSAPSWQPLPH